MENEMRLEFLSKSANEGFARVAVAAFLAQMDPTVELLSDVKTAVSEAVTNAIVHGYGNAKGFVSLECRVSGNQLRIVVTDKGKGMEDIDAARRPLYTTGGGEERSGMGFTVMETFMDTVEVESALGRGTTVTMKKTLRL